MTQKKVVIDYADRDLAHRAAGFFEELFIPTPQAVTVFEQPEATQHNWRVEAYFEVSDNAADLLNHINQDLGHLAGRVYLEDVPELNWVALSQAALPPVTAGRFTVYGSHDRHRIAHGPNSILIDAGEAFGTAHHATTYGCLAEIDRLGHHHAFGTALDLGCGSAVLSIALARTQPRAQIIASDVDAQSIQVAKNNIRQNRAQRHITALVARGLDHPKLRHRFDYVIANILAGPLIHLAPNLARAVKPGGTLTLSGILGRQAAQIQVRYLSVGFFVCTKRTLDGWTTLTFVKRSSQLRDNRSDQ